MRADRRDFVRRASLVAVFGMVGAAAFFEAVAKLESPPPATISQTIGGGSQATGSGSQMQTIQAPSGYFFVAPASALSGKPSAYFTHPTGGSSILVDYGGQWRAFSAYCTHAGCVVELSGSSIYCPCHAGYFSPVDGSVQSGPPPTPLPEYGVVIQGGNVYVSQNRVN